MCKLFKSFILLAGISLLLAGCAKEESLTSAELGGEQTTVTFTASMDSGTATKATDDGDGTAASVNRCIMEIYYGDNLFNRKITKVESLTASFTVTVVANRTYTVAFWADHVDAPETEQGLAADKYYTTTSLKAISLKGEYAGNDDARDAFYHCGSYEVSQSGGTWSDIKLTRPFSQVNVITTDLQTIKPVPSLKPESVKVTVKQAYTEFNAVSGELTVPQDLTYTASLYKFPATIGETTTNATLSMDYLFAPTTQEVIDIDWKAGQGTDASTGTVSHAFTNIPYERNYRTNIQGALLTTTGIWTATVTPTWETSEYDVPYYAATVSSVSDLNTTLASDDAAAAEEVSVTVTTPGTGTSTVTFTDKNNDQTVNLTFESGFGSNKTITFQNEGTGANGPKNLNITAPSNTSLNFTSPQTHVVINGTYYESISGTFSENSLIIEEGVTVTTLSITAGGLEIHGTVNNVTSVGADVIVRDCEGLTSAVYTALESKIATGYKGVKNGETYDIVPISKCKIGDTVYASLELAIKSVKSGETITLLQPVESAGGISVPSDKNFTVDFGGYTYSTECPGAGSAGTQTLAFQLLKNSTITFKNGTINCTAANKDKTWGKDDSVKGIAMIIQNYANLTLENMTIDGTNIAHNGDNVRYIISNNCGTVEYKGATSIKAPAGDKAFDVCKYSTYTEPSVTWNSTGTIEGGIELSGGTFTVARNLAVNAPIVATAAANLVVNADVTPASSYTTVKGYNDALVVVDYKGDLTISGTGSIKAGNNSNIYAAVKMTAVASTTDDAAKLTVNSGTLSGYYYAITGNGTRHNTSITINGGTLTATATDGLGIFHPQEGTLSVSGGNITGYQSAIEMRAGTLNITGGTFTATSDEFKCEANGSGTTTVGAAIAIAQHTTQKDITVEISGGTFNGKKALNEANPQGNNPAPKIDMGISGGTFNGEVTLTDVSKCITGGTYSVKPADDYVADGYAATQDGSVWKVEAKTE